MDIAVVHNERMKLGEGAIWDGTENALLWVDIENRQLFRHRWGTEKTETIELPSRIGTVVPVEGGGYLVALEDGLYSVDRNLNPGSQVYAIEPEIATNRCNDGKCDAYGRLWVGTMAISAEQSSGCLYSFDGKNLKPQIYPTTISNGLAWSLDNRFFYFIDTPLRSIQIFHFDLQSGKIGAKKGAIHIPETEGYPDGMAIDENGHLWVALYGGAGVIRCNPITQKIEQKIDLSAKNVTSCAFGGEQLDTLYITTAAQNLSPGEEESYPQSGFLLSVRVGIRGIPANCFKTYGLE